MSNSADSRQGELMTLPEVAEYLNMSGRTIYDWAQRGRIPAFKLGAAWRFRRGEVDAWLEARRVGSAEPAVSEMCSVCGRTLSSSLPMAGRCIDSGCDLPLCRICWGALGRRACPAHIGHGDDVKAGASTPRAIGSPTALVIARYLDGFQGRVELRNQLMTSAGRVAAEVKDWGKIQSSNEQRVDARSVTNGRRRRAGETNTIVLRKVSYQARLKRDVIETAHRSVALEAWALSPGNGGGKPAGSRFPQSNATTLTAILEPVINGARESDVHRVVGVFSPAGWTADAVSLMDARDPTDRFLSPHISVALVGPGLADVSRNPNDDVLADFIHYLTPSFEDEVASFKRQIQEELKYLDAFLLSRGETEYGFVKRVVQVAADSLVRADEVELTTEDDEVVLIKRGVR